MNDLERIKCADLTLYARTLGYVEDKRESYRTGKVMRGPHGDKIVVNRKPSGHFTFWNTHSADDKGTIIDFCITRTGKGTGEALKDLREWLCIPVPPANENHVIEIAPEKNLKAVQFRWESMKIAQRHQYLEERGIPALMFGEYWRFRGSVKTDWHGNACFAHSNADGLCGYEIRGPEFKGFAKGAEKGLFKSKSSSADTRLMFCESAVECLSACSLLDDGQTRYASISGQFSDTQRTLVQREIQRLGGKEVVAAMNADDAGRRLGDMVRQEVKKSGVADIGFTRIEPVGEKDWNKALQASREPRIARMRTLIYG